MPSSLKIYPSQRVINVFLRGFTMFSKLILIFFLIELFEPKDVGLWGMFVATVATSALIIGGDYYSFSNRELIGLNDKYKQVDILKNQWTAYFFLYLILLPPQLMLFYYKFLPWEYLSWYFLILIVEHQSQEMYRIIIALKHQISASVLLFVRYGIWVWIVLWIFLTYPESRSVKVLFQAWFIGGLFSLVAGIVVIKKSLGINFNKISNSNSNSNSKFNIIKGLKVSVVFFIATVFLKILFTSDKYIIDELGSDAELAAYVFYTAIVFGIMNLLDPAIFSFLYPELVHHHKDSKRKLFESTVKELATSTAIISLVLGLLLVLGFHMYFLFRPNEIYQSYEASFYTVVLAGLFFTWSMVPHFCIYAKGKDVYLLIATVISTVVFILCVYFLNFFTSVILSVSYSLLIATILIFILKFLLYVKIK